MHVVGGLERDPAGVERDPLPHQSEVVPRTAPAAMAHHDEARLFVAALRDREVAAHPERAAPGGVQDFDADAGLLR